MWMPWENLVVYTHWNEGGRELSSSVCGEIADLQEVTAYLCNKAGKNCKNSFRKNYF